MRQSNVSILDVAKQIGVSKTTVGYVLSGQSKNQRVSEKTSRLVKDAAKKLGYVPNHLARSLQKQCTGTISTLLTGIKTDFSDKVMEGIEEVLEANDYMPVIIRHSQKFLSSEDSDSNHNKRVLSILSRRDEGVICQPTPKARSDYETLVAYDLPVVFLGSLLEDMSGLEAVSSVTWDCCSAVKVAVKHLIDTGHEKIGFIGARHGVDSDHSRFRAFIETLKEHSLPVKEEWMTWGDVYKYPSVESIDKMFKRENEKPDAFFVINDAVAFDVIDDLDRLGIKVPDDIAIVGMGNLEMSGFNRISLTTMEEPLIEMGRESAKILLAMIKNPKAEPVHRKIQHNRLVVRKSAPYVGRESI